MRINVYKVTTSNITYLNDNEKQHLLLKKTKIKETIRKMTTAAMAIMTM